MTFIRTTVAVVVLEITQLPSSELPIIFYYFHYVLGRFVRRSVLTARASAQRPAYYLSFRIRETPPFFSRRASRAGRALLRAQCLLFIMRSGEHLAAPSGGAFCLRAPPPNGLLIIYYSGSAKHPQKFFPARFARRGLPHLFLIIFIIDYAAILIQSQAQTSNPIPDCFIFYYIYYRHHCIPVLVFTPPAESRKIPFIFYYIYYDLLFSLFL